MPIKDGFMDLKKVSQSQIIKIALLLAVLSSIPRKIHLYNMISEGKIDFTGVWVADSLFRILFLSIFCWTILYINANLGYAKFRLSTSARIISHIAIDIAVLFAILTIWKFLHPILIDNPLSDQDKGFLFFRYSILLIVLFFIARILRLQTDQQANIIENERLKQENLKNELAALKNQINPHFLFNSLNSLTSLIRDNEKATQFVKKLSYMYRYILQSGDIDLVSVKDELKFLESYTYLINSRYRNRFAIDIEIDDKYLEEKIPPLSLQILVENAVKHNEISESNPLQVKVYSKNESLFVDNPIRPRTTLAEGTGNGLANLKKRYALLRKQEINVNSDDTIFSVELPLN
jgi:sensor histidine kinase YesM